MSPLGFPGGAVVGWVDWLPWLILGATALTLALLLPFALHRIHLVLLARNGRPDTEVWTGPLPTVTVQLPVYNEAEVVERLVDAAASLDYPPELLEVQLLDDSSERTVERARARVHHWRKAGIRIEHLRRADRTGYKAGALASGLAKARGEFLLILDADFVPSRDLIHQLLGPFRDPQVGMVQARWDHMNEHQSLLTRCQALLLDAHFFFEQGGRWAADWFMSFNGTAGMWRRRALEESGGWSADTLTEDLDLSYRAQMAGWRFCFRAQVGVPAELPDTVRSLELQQKRWAQGGIQTARKLLPTLLRGPWRTAVKIEAVIHLLGHLAHPLTLLLGILLLPSALSRRALGLEGLLILDLFVFAAATVSFLFFYCAAGRKRRRPWRSLVPTAFAVLAAGVGLGATVSGAVLRGARPGIKDPFHRTPKRGARKRSSVGPPSHGGLLVKAALTGWMGISCAIALQQGLYATLPFIVLFGAGYGWFLIGDVGAAVFAELIPAGPRASSRRGKHSRPEAASAGRPAPFALDSNPHPTQTRTRPTHT